MTDKEALFFGPLAAILPEIMVLLLLPLAPICSIQKQRRLHRNSHFSTASPIQYVRIRLSIYQFLKISLSPSRSIVMAFSRFTCPLKISLESSFKT